MPPTPVMTMDDASKGAACVCFAIPIGAIIVAAVLKLNDSGTIIVIGLGVVVGVILSISIMKGYWTGFK